jgi:hypothetical protein
MTKHTGPLLFHFHLYEITDKDFCCSSTKLEYDFVVVAICIDFRDLKIDLFTQGRLKGQAFITFPCVEMATQALEEVHGFVLKGKPLVIVCNINQFSSIYHIITVDL